MKRFGFGGTNLVRCLRNFTAAHFSVHKHFNKEHQLFSRFNFKLNCTAALAEWRQLLRA